MNRAGTQASLIQNKVSDVEKDALICVAPVHLRNFELNNSCICHKFSLEFHCVV